MKIRAERSNLIKVESGQAAALVALLLFVVFLPFAALAIDGAMIYLVRRDLQNVADAAALSACRVLADGGDSAAGTVAAQNTIQTNLGSWAEYTAPQLGTGTSLLRGIEVSDVQARVALQGRVPTVLTQFLGHGQTLVTAQARCDSRAGGGLMPIAVQRYDGETGGTLRDYLGNKSASGVPPTPPPVPYPTDSIVTTWAGRYGPFDVPVPKAEYETSDGALEADNTGPEVLLLGQSAETNNNESSMRDLILLDIRNVASVNSLEYYNGANSQGDAAKYMSQNWIYQHGYPGPYPQVGSQVAILDGASNNFAAAAMQTAGYRPGDAVATIVYDGFVWTAPDFVVDLAPTNVSNGIMMGGYPTSDATAVSYDVSIAKGGAASHSWYSPLDFNLKLIFTEAPFAPLPPGTYVTLNGNELSPPDYAYSVSNVTEAGWNGTLRIWSTEAVTQVSYLSGLNLVAVSNLGMDRGASSNFGFGMITSDYTVRSNSGKVVVRMPGPGQGDTSSVNLITFGAGLAFPGGQGCRNMPVRADILLGGVPQPWGTFFLSDQNTAVNIRKDTDQSGNLALKVSGSAFVGQDYMLRLTLDPGSCSGVTLSHSVVIPLEILPAAPSAIPDRFVIIQGYAVFRVSRVDANDVWGYAISPLYPKYEDIRVGLRSRLVPWE